MPAKPERASIFLKTSLFFKKMLHLVKRNDDRFRRHGRLGKLTGFVSNPVEHDSKNSFCPSHTAPTSTPLLLAVCRATACS
jgi:hypothetical protein